MYAIGIPGRKGTNFKKTSEMIRIGKSTNPLIQETC